MTKFHPRVIKFKYNLKTQFRMINNLMITKIYILQKKFKKNRFKIKI